MGFSNALFAQYFEGEIELTNVYLDNNSGKQLFAPFPEIVSIKGPMFKSFLPNAEKGALEWSILDYSKGVSYSRKSYRNINYFVTDKEPTFSADGKIQFSKPDSPMVAPIMKGKSCTETLSVLDVLNELDTTLFINGFKCKVIVRKIDGIKVNEYYYSDSIKIPPSQYSCSIGYHLNKVYKKTNGALIVQFVEFSNDFVWIQQVRKVRAMKISDESFALPEGIKIQEYTKD